MRNLAYQLKKRGVSRHSACEERTYYSKIYQIRLAHHCRANVWREDQWLSVFLKESFACLYFQNFDVISNAVFGIIYFFALVFAEYCQRERGIGFYVFPDDNNFLETVVKAQRDFRTFADDCRRSVFLIYQVLTARNAF